MSPRMLRSVHRDEAGFTLVELLVVIVILGILAAVVVFSVRGITDNGRAAACNSDLRMLITAEETNYANTTDNTGTWALSQDALMDAGLIARRSTLYDVTAPVAPSTTYSIVRRNPDCPAPPIPA